MATANEMKYTLLLKFDSMFEFAAPAYDDRQISFVLTDAQNRVFLNKYYPPTNDIRRGFEADEKRRRELEQLIKSATISGSGDISVSSSQTGVHTNGIFYDMPSDFLYAIEESAKLTGGTVEIPVKPITHDAYNANKNNPYKKPYSGLVWRMDFSRQTDASGTATAATAKRVELIHDGTGISDYRVRYLRMPPAIVVDETTPANQRHCVLDVTMHNIIIDEAVKIMKAAVTPETYQIADKESIENRD